MTAKLDGKVALVSGSGRGIGRAIALKLASEGARLVVNDLDADPALEVVKEITAMGGEAVACVGSVTAPDFAERFIGTAVERYKALDIIVNNAGYTWDNVIQKMTDEQWYAIMDVHVTAPFRILRAFAPYLRSQFEAESKRGERIVRKVVQISSTSGVRGNAGQINYSSAKAAVTGMTRTLAKEWGRYAVTVNCVAFGYVQTRLTKPLAEGEAGTIEVAGRQVKVGVQGARIAAMNQMIPLGRGGLPEEAAGAIYLFCSPDSDFVSGQTLVVTGGA
jgi:3-oxoacyl-[acyl-carrier protein] reductase